tara:strand:+ start:62 stop:244 length:183 start_codon:yes stop_codon:yes gene_type:complete
VGLYKKRLTTCRTLITNETKPNGKASVTLFSGNLFDEINLRIFELMLQVIALKYLYYFTL